MKGQEYAVTLTQLKRKNINNMNFIIGNSGLPITSIFTVSVALSEGDRVDISWRKGEGVAL